MSKCTIEDYLNQYCGEYITGFKGIKNIYGIDLIYTSNGDGLLINFNNNNSTETVIISLTDPEYIIPPQVKLSNEDIKELNTILDDIWDNIKSIYKKGCTYNCPSLCNRIKNTSLPIIHPDYTLLSD